ncbi:MAG: FAD-dependent oxidoreductase [Gammaproteobacteria bacterium]
MIQFDALIIGGGPSGATAALLLAKAGWSVAIVEKKTFPRRKVCGEFISATSLPLLQKLGIAQLYLTKGGPEVRRVGLFASDSMLISKMPPLNHSVHRWGRALGREHLDTVLLAAAESAGATLWQPCQVKNLKRNSSMFTGLIVSKDGTINISARIVISAQGSWEPETSPLSKPNHRRSDMLAFKAHFKNSELTQDLMPLLAFPGGYGGLVHTDNGRVTLSCCIRRDTLQKVRERYRGMQAGEAVFQHIMTTCLGVRKTLTNAKREGAWLAVGPIRPGIRQCYADGVFYAGNIAGEAHPVVAEGISMAMQSAWLLSDVLINRQKDILTNTGIDEAGAAYTKQWKRQFISRIYAAKLFAQFAMRPWITAMVLPIIKIFPGLLSVGAKMSGKIQQVILKN